MTAMHELELTGPNGANPLGFLCALGAFRTLANIEPMQALKMSWRRRAARWHPVLQSTIPLNIDELAELLCTELKRPQLYPPVEWKHSHDVKRSEFRRFALMTTGQDSGLQDHFGFSWAAALMNEALADKNECLDDTAFRTLSGAGHQNFLGQFHLLCAAVSARHIVEALSDWKYQDLKLNLRYDPVEDRRHAYRWLAPESDPIKTVWGANVLAVQALPLHPVFVVGGGLETTGFTGRRNNDAFWTWPIWDGFADLPTTAALLALRSLQVGAKVGSKQWHVVKRELHARGVVEVMRSQRLPVGKFRAFSQAESI